MKNAAGNPVARTIQVGITDGLYSEVVSGDLHEGDPVILSQSTAN